ncbi:MAG TPA: DNA polymerase IV [Gammaproteobacteria bacterium]|nr:DNA polymerase IV [Gammaproteobacteria bacterium]
MNRWPRIVVHADMDAFYAAVEQLDNPSLRGKPVLIGPNSYRGVVLTASYEARPFGVGSAMPVAEARRRCPQAIMVAPRFERYQQISEQIMNIFADFSPSVEALSLDEAFLEMTGAEHIFGGPESMGLKIKKAVKEMTHLNISVGVSGTKYVPKVASDHDKPNGLTVVPQAQAVEWLAPLPITRLWGVGKKTAPKLRALGYETIGDIANADERTISLQLGSAGRHFHQLAHARDPRRVLRGRAARSIGSDRTLGQDISSHKDIEVHLRRSAQRIARRIRKKDYVAGGVRVRLKTNKFEMFSRQRQLKKPIDTAEAIFSTGKQLLKEFNHPGPFRLVGMAAFDLHWRCEPQQLDFFEDPVGRDLETTIDDLLDRFGEHVITRARDLGNSGNVMSDGVNLDFLDHRDGERVSAPAK